MKSIKSVFGLIIFGVSVMLFASSCQKCKFDDDTSSGIVDMVGEEKVVLYPASGFMSTSNYHITDAHPLAGNFEVSFDGGITRVPIDWNTYHILGNPMTIHCEASFDRSVSLDALNNVVTYRVVATTCENCENERAVDNWVLVEAIPAGYTLDLQQEETVQ